MSTMKGSIYIAGVSFLNEPILSAIVIVVFD